MFSSRDAFENDFCPVRDELLGEMYRASEHGLPKLVESVSPQVRAMNESARIGVRSRQPQPHMHGVLGESGIEWLPGIGERALAEMRLEACGDAGGLRSVG